MSGEDRAATKDQKRQRGTCAECKREFDVTRAGTIRMHGDVGPGSWLMNCRGSGQQPSSLVADPIAEAEDRGYRRAVQALRDEAAWADYMLSLDDDDLYGEDNLIAANFLELHATAAPRNEGAQT